MHICDNPSCVNPKHLRLGTKRENNSDMREKKRSARGQRNGKAKLTNEQAIAIADGLKRGETGRSLAKRFGVSEITVSMIKHGKRWIYLDELRNEL
jgi:DNA-binding NarL/FixJ family response regulator